MAMTPAERQMRLKQSGYTQKDIADRCGVAQATVSQVINGYATSKPIQTEIARAIKKARHEVFAERRKPV